MEAASKLNHIPTPTSSNNRLEFIDACRGVCIMAVVYIHATLLCDTQALNFTNILFELSRMAIFFFISGYLMYDMRYDVAISKKRSMSRVVHQLYPTLLIWTLYLSTFHLPPWSKIDPSISSIVGSQFKGGYWFVFVMLEMYFLCVPLLYFFTTRKVVKWKQSIALMGIYLVVLFINACADSYSGPSSLLRWVYDLTSCKLLVTNLPFFILGMVGKMFKNEFMKIVSNKWTAVVGVVLFVAFSGFPCISAHMHKISIH